MFRWQWQLAAGIDYDGVDLDRSVPIVVAAFTSSRMRSVSSPRVRFALVACPPTPNSLQGSAAQRM